MILGRMEVATMTFTAEQIAAPSPAYGSSWLITPAGDGGCSLEATQWTSAPKGYCAR